MAKEDVTVHANVVAPSATREATAFTGINTFFTISAIAPASPQHHDVWMDITAGVMKYYDSVGATWVTLGA